MHIHFITNTVSYEDGHKLHATKKDLERMKQLTNQMCKDRGLSIPEKGKDFHGNMLKEGEMRAWNKDKYRLMLNGDKDSYLVDYARAYIEAKEESETKEMFVKAMLQRGWEVIWRERRKHITFRNQDGKKVRDSNLAKTFQMEVGKEELEHEFERKKKERKQRKERRNEGTTRKY